jgi:predicted permease
MAMGSLQVFDAKTFVPHATRFVFYVALPLLVLKGLGVGIDFYDDSFLWNFIGAFLILRVIALVISLGMVLRNRKDGIGEVAVLWLSLTWISTVILGVPIAGAVFNDPAKGKTYGILAGISSFIFQLPLQLFFLECHLLEKENLESKKRSTTIADEEQPPTPLETTIVDEEQPPTPMEADDALKEYDENTPPPESVPPEEHDDLGDGSEGPSLKEGTNNEEKLVPLSLWLEFAQSRGLWKRILGQLIRNPIVWGITGGFVLSLSTLGPRFLNPTSEDFVPGLQWFAMTTGWFGDCVSPVSLFAMGVWMQAEGKKIFRIPVLSAILFMLSKLVIVPLLMVGLAKAVNLNDEAGRAAVLIASLPISMASFSLVSRYKIGEAVLSENVALGTALILPTVLLWNLIMDAVGLFPIAT